MNGGGEEALAAVAGAVMIGALLASLLVILLFVIAMWRIFSKAGEEGWKAIIPIYNLFVLVRICGRDWYWVLLFLIPVVSSIVGIILMLDLAKSFGRSTAFAIGLILLSPIFILILAFGDAEYQGPTPCF